MKLIHKCLFLDSQGKNIKENKDFFIPVCEKDM